MSVHLQIKNQINQFIKGEKKFQQLEAKREQLIDDILSKAKNHEEYSLLEVNAVTAEMNQLSKKLGFPTRKLITVQMVQEYINRKK